MINTLNNSKLTSSVIQTRVKEAEVTEKEINEAREKYRPVANRGSIIYFVVADLALIGPMYQNSLVYFSKLFNYCIDNSEKSDNLDKRLEILKDYLMNFIYDNICRGIFEEHKVLFSFMLISSITRARGDITPEEWSFCLRGTAGKRRCCPSEVVG